MKEFTYGEFDVSQDRDNYIGGSDVAAIMGLSTFKTRWQLLLEKAGLEHSNFSGNRFTEYGNILEPKIRNYINMFYGTNFKPARVIDGDFRYHADGFNGECVLEIKTTSSIFATVDGYKSYLVQLLKGMEENGVDKGKLAVYERPEDFSTEFDPRRLQTFDISIEDYKPLLAKVNKELDRFRSDLARLKENPLLTEQDFLPIGEGIVALSNKIVAFEKQLAAMKEIEQKCKEAKQALYNEMLKHDLKSWTTPNGTKITMVAASEGSTKAEFDTAAFKKENPDMYKRYLKEKKTSGRAGYIKITLNG